MNPSSLTAIGNDYDFSEIFSRELEAIGTCRDVFIPISTSGNSLNIIKATKIANNKGMYIVGMTGGDGGKLSEICQETIMIPVERTERIQEGHILCGHIICATVEDMLFGDKK